jgi:uracil-DNA glycosylase family 4
MDASSPSPATARRILAQRLESLERSGVLQIGKVPALPAGRLPAAEVSGESQQARSAPTNVSASPFTSAEKGTSPEQEAPMPRTRPAVPLDSDSSRRMHPYPDSPRNQSARQLQLDALNEQVRGCTLCALLARQRTQTVFGVGNPLARVVFFGEAPGADEDRQGEPFVGRAGQLLTKIIEACGWRREDVYILNVLKCRPPDNRNPEPAETANCRPFFERQLEILQPEYIVCVGTVPSQALLETAESIGKLRSRFHRYRDSKVLATYHPSYLLRNPSAKKYVWEDMQLLMRDMGVPIPGKG